MKNENKMGRPTKLTPALQDEIVEYLKAGNYIETACAVVGVGRSTYYDWIKRANEATRQNKYTRFRDAVNKAQAWAEARLVAIISRQAEKSWTAAAWLLERRHTEKWDKNKNEPTKTDKKEDDDQDTPPEKPEPVNGDVSHISPEDQEFIGKILSFAARTPKKLENPDWKTIIIEYLESEGISITTC